MPNTASQHKLFRSSLLNKKIDSQAVYKPHRMQVFAGKHKIEKQTDGIARKHYAIVAFDSTIITYNQMEACRKIVVRRIKRHKAISTYLTCLKFTLPLTSKGEHSRMGKGKGGVLSYVARVKTFDTLFVLRNFTHACAAGILLQMAYKLPFRIGLRINSMTRSNFSGVHR